MSINDKASGFNRKMPIGIQDFESLRHDGYLYVDKTAYIFRLAHEGKPYFLSRPRRFGKSLFLSTLKAYWEGRKDLFEGLEIIRLEEDLERASRVQGTDPEKQYHAWQPHPVFYFDFNKDNFNRERALEDVLSEHLDTWESLYDVEQKELPLAARFRRLIELAVEKTGRNAVVLVDEYDKPLLEAITNPEMEEHNKEVFKGFFSTLKSYDHYLKFVFLTGVTKFSKVSVFSDLNQLRDISMLEPYVAVCGITQKELEENFSPEIEETALSQHMTTEQVLERLRKCYDGYVFRHDTQGVYNPFSLLNALTDHEFGSYWFSTGTPTFLVKKLQEINFDVKKFTDGSINASAAMLSDYRADNPDPIPLLFQSGYLTIQRYDGRYGSYELGYPNEEVKYGFINSLAPTFLNDETMDSPLDIRQFGMDIEKGDTDALRERLIALYARLPYTTDDRPLENNFQNVIYIVFMLLGQFIHTEVHNAKGRADAVVETDDYVYLFEFKRDGSAKEALQQIEEKGYAAPYAADKRTLLKIGASFDSKERNLTEWEVEEETSR